MRCPPCCLSILFEANVNHTQYLNSLLLRESPVLKSTSFKAINVMALFCLIFSRWEWEDSSSHSTPVPHHFIICHLLSKTAKPSTVVGWFALLSSHVQVLISRHSSLAISFLVLSYCGFVSIDWLCLVVFAQAILRYLFRLPFASLLCFTLGCTQQFLLGFFCRSCNLML